MNPYARFLEGQDAAQVIPGTPARLEAAIRRLGEERVQKPLAPGKWSPREILCHLADCELAFAFRLRQALAESHHVIQPFDQDQWARSYNAYDAQTALEVFGAVRRWNLRLLAKVSATEMEKLVRHPERGEMTFAVIVETMAGHDLNHVQQIEALTGE